MNLQQFKQALDQHPNCELTIQFANGQQVAPHFHVTEIGKVTKDFVDCGGTRRTNVACVLQTLVANDFDHRLKSDKLAKIVGLASVLELEDTTPVEVEVQTDTIGVYSFDSFVAQAGRIVFIVASKKTACLAPDTCGLDLLPVTNPASQGDCCGETGCC